jgi:hypothetical protein
LFLRDQCTPHREHNVHYKEKPHKSVEGLYVKGLFSNCKEARTLSRALEELYPAGAL